MEADRFELVIVGAGPGGLSAAAHAAALGLRVVVLERAAHLADTLVCYQAGKRVMAEPGLIPRRSELPFEEGSREEILGGWQRFADDAGLDVRYGQEVQAITPAAGGFLVLTKAGERFESGKVVVAIGTQGNPRRLDVPGDDLPHVATRLVDPADHTDEDILVVGAGDAAIEIALALAPNNRVSLLVRGPEIVRAKEALERELLAQAARGQLQLLFSTVVTHIEEGSARLKGPKEDLTVPADRVFLKLGATPPARLLKEWGVQLEGEGRNARPVLSAACETSVPGLYLIGAVAGRDLIKLAINQGYEVVEHIVGNEVDPADEEILCARLPVGSGKARERIAALRERVPLLAAAQETELRELFLSAEVKRYPPGTVILRQDDYTDSFLIVLEGQVAIAVRRDGGGAQDEADDRDQRQVAVLGAGEFFGEMSLISGRRRSATATARGSTGSTTGNTMQLLEIPRKAILKLLQTSPAVRELVDRTFLARAFQKYLFPQTSADRLAGLVARATLERYERNSPVFAEGDAGDAFYLIRSGMVKISRRSAEREMVLSYLVAGNTFGETALLAGAVRTASVAAIFPTELIRLSRQDCDAFLAEYPELRHGFVETLERRRIDNLIAEATPGAGEVLTDLIEHEVVMGTDALIIDNHKCVRCDNCIRACEGVHDDRQARLSLTGISFYNLLAPNSCWQCENPLCMLDCPPDAIVRNPRGEVYIKSNCIGCGNCEANCPYGNIFMVHPKPAAGRFGWLQRLLGLAEPKEIEREVAVKCDLCSSLVGGPACVRSCPTGAAIRLDPQSYQQTLEELVVRRGEA